MWNDAAVLLSAGIIIGALMLFFSWLWDMVKTARRLKRIRLYQIQTRLREIHEILAYGTTTMFQRQELFTEMYDLLDERRDVLYDR